MEINIKLNKNFTTQYNKLQNEFGTEIAKINGFDDGNYLIRILLIIL